MLALEGTLAEAKRIANELLASVPRGQLALTADQLSELGDRCIIDAVLPGTNAERRTESIQLAARCYAMAAERSS